jgi:putative ABC transport system permease protein
MLFFYAFRNVQRNFRRSLLTMTTVMLGCTLLTIGLSWLYGIYNSFVQSSIENGGFVRISTETYYQKETLIPLEENIVNTEPLIESIINLDQVTSVYPRIMQGVAASVGGEEIGEVFGVLIGAPIDYYENILQLEKHIYKGSFFTRNPADEGLIGLSLANDMGITVGDEAIFVGVTQDGSISPIKVSIVGLLNTGNSVQDRQAFVHIDKARWMADIPNGATELLVYGEGNAAVLTQSIVMNSSDFSKQSETFNSQGSPANLVFLPWNKREPFASIIIIPKVVSAILASIIILITALGVLNTMMMSVLERTNENGILRALGMPKNRIAFSFILESLIISITGGFFGVIIGSSLSIWMARTGINLGDSVANTTEALPINTTLYPEWSIELAIITFVVSVLMAILGAAIPAWQANQVSPIEAIKAKN